MGLAITAREFWLLFHLVVGVILIHGFLEGMFGLYHLSKGALSFKRLRRVLITLWAMAIAAWATVISGTWKVYAWYRAKPSDEADLLDYPRSYLLANPDINQWHKFGMEWKEHVGWLTPILVTAVAFVLFYYGSQLIKHQLLRRSLMVMLVVAFAAAVISGGLGAAINKIAPNTFLDL